MKLSARDQRSGAVTSVNEGAAIANVEIDVHGQRLVASVFPTASSPSTRTCFRVGENGPRSAISSSTSAATWRLRGSSSGTSAAGRPVRAASLAAWAKRAQTRRTSRSSSGCRAAQSSAHGGE